MNRRVCTIFILVFFASVALEAKEMDVDNSCRTLPPLPLPCVNWKEPERCVWAKVRAGEIADLRCCYCRSVLDMDKYSHERNIRSSFIETILLYEPFLKLIPHNGVHIIGAVFDQKINLENAELKHQLRLEDCRFEKTVNLSGLITPYSISLSRSFADKELDISGAKIGGSLEMDEGTFCNVEMGGTNVDQQLTMKDAKFAGSGTLNMQGVKVGGDLIMDGGEFNETNLNVANINRQLTMDNSTFLGKLEMNGIEVGSQLSAKESKFHNEVFMNGAIVKNQLTMGGAKFSSSLLMNGLRVNKRLCLEGTKVSGELAMKGSWVDCDLIMKKGNFDKVNLETAVIDGQLIMERATFSDKVTTYGLKVRDQIKMDGATFKETLSMQGSAVGSILSLRDCTFDKKVSLKEANTREVYTDNSKFNEELDMEKITIGGSLIFKKGRFEKKVNVRLAKIGCIEYKGPEIMAHLNIEGTHADRILIEVEGKEKDWPDQLDLQGFTYDLFVGEYTGPSPHPHRKEWFQAWLDKMREYSPQPYEQCANALRESGQPENANTVRYMGKEEERQKAWDDNNIKRWLGLSILNITIGYGLGARYFWCLWWAGGLMILGTIIFCTARNNHKFIESEQQAEPDQQAKPVIWMKGLAYSLDMLLPLIKLQDKHEKYELPGWRLYYFYLHKMVGWILASFILAGLAGITQR